MLKRECFGKTRKNLLQRQNILHLEVLVEEQIWGCRKNLLICEASGGGVGCCGGEKLRDTTSTSSEEQCSYRKRSNMQELDNTNVFVKYLPPEMKERELSNLFSPFGGIVSAKVMVDPHSGSSLGYGYVKIVGKE